MNRQNKGITYLVVSKTIGLFSFSGGDNCDYMPNLIPTGPLMTSGFVYRDLIELH